MEENLFLKIYKKFRIGSKLKKEKKKKKTLPKVPFLAFEIDSYVCSYLCSSKLCNSIKEMYKSQMTIKRNVNNI